MLDKNNCSSMSATLLDHEESSDRVKEDSMVISRPTNTKVELCKQIATASTSTGIPNNETEIDDGDVQSNNTATTNDNEEDEEYEDEMVVIEDSMNLSSINDDDNFFDDDCHQIDDGCDSKDKLARPIASPLIHGTLAECPPPPPPSQPSSTNGDDHLDHLWNTSTSNDEKRASVVVDIDDHSATNRPHPSQVKSEKCNKEEDNFTNYQPKSTTTISPLAGLSSNVSPLGNRFDNTFSNRLHPHVCPRFLPINKPLQPVVSVPVHNVALYLMNNKSLNRRLKFAPLASTSSSKQRDCAPAPPAPVHCQTRATMHRQFTANEIPVITTTEVEDQPANKKIFYMAPMMLGDNLSRHLNKSTDSICSYNGSYNTIHSDYSMASVNPSKLATGNEFRSFNQPTPENGLSSAANELKNRTHEMLQSNGVSNQDQIKRRKSIIQKVLGNADVPKKPVCTRLSILGKPLPVNSRKNILFHKQRSIVYNFLQRPKSRKAMAYHAFVIIVILIGLLFASLNTVRGWESWTAIGLHVMDIIIIALLSVEFIVRVWSSACISKYQGLKGIVRFILSPFRVIDLFVIATSAVVLWVHYISPHNGYIAWIRFAQTFQILRLANRFKPWRIMASVFWAQRNHLVVGVYMSFLFLMIISFTVYFAEQSNPQSNFTSIPKSMWWGIVTLFTIGYGDMAPTTTAGKIIASLFILIGVSMFALPAGILGTGLALKVQEEQRQKHVHKRLGPAASLIQCAWRCYASSPNSRSNATWKACVKQHEEKRSQKKFSSKLSFEDFQHPECLSSIPSSATFRSRFIDEDRTRKLSESRINMDDDQCDVLDRNNYRNYFSAKEKNAIRFIRFLRYLLARRKFKNAFKPNDINDVMEQYAAGHTDMLSRVRNMQARINSIQGSVNSVMNFCREIHLDQGSQIERIERILVEIDRVLVHGSSAYCAEPEQANGNYLSVYRNGSQSYSAVSSNCQLNRMPPMYNSALFDCRSGSNDWRPVMMMMPESDCLPHQTPKRVRRHSE